MLQLLQRGLVVLLACACATAEALWPRFFFDLLWIYVAIELRFVIVQNVLISHFCWNASFNPFSSCWDPLFFAEWQTSSSWGSPCFSLSWDVRLAPNLLLWDPWIDCWLPWERGMPLGVASGKAWSKTSVQHWAFAIHMLRVLCLNADAFDTMLEVAD